MFKLRRSAGQLFPELGISLGTFTLAEGNYQAITFGEGCENDGTLVEGCTDPNAFNYDPTASVDDGSCSYDCICDDVYDPVLVTTMSPENT